MEYVVAEHVRSLHEDGGTVLLDLARGAYFGLDAVGAEIWESLSKGAGKDGAIDRLEVRYKVPRERLAGDVDALIQKLVDKELLVPRSPVAHGRARSLLEGYATLVGMDLVLKVAGFDRFHRFVRRVPTLRAGARSHERAAALCRAVDRAAGFYFKRAWCLQRSAAATCLLRLHGYPAELVIGVRRMPFMAHAWVEVDGAVVNDDPHVQKIHTAIERC